LSRFYSENFVIALATAVAVFDVFFILVAVPESLPDKLRERSKTITWDQVDPFKVHNLQRGLVSDMVATYSMCSFIEYCYLA
jgi:hypothetical protein